MNAMPDSHEDEIDAHPTAPDVHEAQTLLAAETIKIDADVLEWFRARSTEHERLINAVLRKYVQLHEQNCSDHLINNVKTTFRPPTLTSL